MTNLSPLTELTIRSPPPTEAIATAGATVSTAKAKAEELPELPAASLWLAVTDLLAPCPRVMRLAWVSV